MDVRRLLIVGGIVLVAAGVLWPWLSRAGLGRLPGDIAIQRQNFSFYFPVVTCLVISVAVALLLWVFRE